MKRIFAMLMAISLMLGCGALADVTLNVTGSGTVYVEADIVTASLGVSMNGDDLETLQQEVNATITAVCDALQAAGMDSKDITTNYIFISPRYDYSDGGEKIVGYSVNNSLYIRTGDLDKIGTYIDAAFAAGANSFDSISFTVSDDSAARMQALELAVQDAHAKAETIAKASGKQLSGMISITEGENDGYWSNTVNGSVAYARTEAADVAMGTTVRAAQVQVTARVQVAYDMVGNVY